MNQDNEEKYKNYWDRKDRRESYTYWGIYAAFIGFGLIMVTIISMMVISEYKNMQYRETCRKQNGIVLTLENSPACFKSSIFEPIDPR